MQSKCWNCISERVCLRTLKAIYSLMELDLNMEWNMIKLNSFKP